MCFFFFFFCFFLRKATGECYRLSFHLGVYWKQGVYTLSSVRFGIHDDIFFLEVEEKEEEEDTLEG